MLTKTTFEFLLRVKQILNGSNEEGKDPSGASKQPPADGKAFRNAFEKEIQEKVVNDDHTVSLIDYDDFFDGLFMKFKIKFPGKETVEQLKWLLCVQFGPHISEKSYLLV